MKGKWMKHVFAWTVVAVIIIVALIIGPTDAKADTLVIYHPDGVEQMQGKFLQLNMQQGGTYLAEDSQSIETDSGGGLEFEATSYDSWPLDRIFESNFEKLPAWWEISLILPEWMDGGGGYVYFQYRCSAYYHYGEGDTSVLELMCAS